MTHLSTPDRELYARLVRAMLVAAGFGTRLDPLTVELPKPALPVGNRPLAWYALDHLARSGFRHVLVNTHHLAERLMERLQAVCPPGLQLQFVHEPRILGTGGGVRNAWKPQPGEDLVLVNPKLLFAPDLERALSVHRASGAIATMVLKPLEEGASFTPIHLDAGGRVRHIGRQRPAGLPAHAPRMFASVQILSARAWRDLPQEGDIIAGAYRAWLARGEVVASVTDENDFMDVGVTLQHYLAANLALANGRLGWPSRIAAPSGVLVAPEARIDSAARIEDSVIGDGAVVEAGAELVRCVVWPSARVSGVHRNAVVTSAGRIVHVPEAPPVQAKPPAL
jgi:mannose-1-phosphate guanylyltransferase